MARIKSDLSTGEYAILGVLRERPMHGYEVARRFAADLDLGLVLPMDMSTVYTLLKDLQEHGLIEGQREVVGLRPPRMVFHLTPEAEAVFYRWLEEPVERLRAVRSDLLIKLYFARTISAALTARLLDAQIAACHAYRDRLAALAAAAEPNSFERLVLRSKVTAADATLTWLQEERATLEG